MFAGLSVGSFFLAVGVLVEGFTQLSWLALSVAGVVFAVISKGVKE